MRPFVTASISRLRSKGWQLFVYCHTTAEKADRITQEIRKKAVYLDHARTSVLELELTDDALLITTIRNEKAKQEL